MLDTLLALFHYAGYVVRSIGKEFCLLIRPFEALCRVDMHSGAS